jgi:hypothetical protein
MIGGTLGHLFFILSHLLAIIFGFFFLFLTVPFHIFFTMARGRGKEIKKQSQMLKEQNELLRGRKKKKKRKKRK